MAGARQRGDHARKQLEHGDISRLRIAAIDRDAAFVRPLSDYLGQIGWELMVHYAPLRHPALLDGGPDALLVDVDLLGPHWEEWLSLNPARSPELGVVVCTGSSTVLQRVRGLRAGADDWITKPCRPEEVCARLQAIVRGHRHGAELDVRPLNVGELELRPDLYDARAGSRQAGLTSREFAILLHLARAEGRPVPREQLYRSVWGFEMARGDRSIDTFIRKIRNKLAEISPDWRYVHTHKGVGYGCLARRGGAAGERQEEDQRVELVEGGAIA